LPPRHMDSVVQIVEALESTDHGVTVPELVRALGACSTPGCRAVLGDPPEVPPAPPTLNHDQWWLFTQLFRHDAAAPERGAVLAPDGSTVTLGPLFAGIEVGLKRVTGWHVPTFEPPVDAPPMDVPPMDALYAVTIAEALGTSFLLARDGDTNRTTLGPGGCWDDVDDPQNYTLLGPPSPVPDAVANGAMDGVLLGTQLAKAPIQLADLLRGYYGTGNGTEKGRPPSSYRQRDFGVLTGPGKLEKEVEAMLRVLRVLPPTRELLEDVGPEEVTAIAQRAARDFMEVYVGHPRLGRHRLQVRPPPTSPSPHRCPRHPTAIPVTHLQPTPVDPSGSRSFVVGSDGYLYQGRGWDWVGAHTKGYNTKGFGVGYVGDFSTTLPDPDTIALVRDGFLPCAVRTGRLQRNYTLRGHRQMGHTDCPGNSLFHEIETWRGFK
ncbi:PGRP2 amidase, partial [Pterocles burchelli]|nr:PGRP2 amidase [Pterocles burchelli]